IGLQKLAAQIIRIGLRHAFVAAKIASANLPHLAVRRYSDSGSALSCAGCGKIGVSICARCSRKPRYRTAIARAHPLQERDPELYKRLDEMSRLSFRENKQSWDEFCIEIKAEDFYEHTADLG
ncbi:MAG TPA: hypothetical protein VKG65_08990, partial [Terriglobales bacterium]|nr:hypothetical protein [Terriglobales bacterium]